MQKVLQGMGAEWVALRFLIMGESPLELITDRKVLVAATVLARG